jgi:hypothetical protein
LETNRGHRVRDLWSDDLRAREEARRAIAAKLSATREEVDAFLDRLRISTPPVPDRQHIVATYAALYAAPALDRLGIVGVSPPRAMRIAFELVAAASVDRVPDSAWVAILAAAPAGVIAEQRLEARCITDEQLKEALLDAARERVPRLQALDDDIAARDDHGAQARGWRPRPVGGRLGATAPSHVVLAPRAGPRHR